MDGLAALALEVVLGMLAPPRCAACDAPVRWLAAFCSACAAQAVPIARDRSTAIAAYAYGGSIARALTRMKYEARPDLARPLGDLLWRAIEPWASDLGPVVVVPVPLHPIRLAERGFNQSALLARRVASRWGAPTAMRALERLHETARQTSLDRRARASNVAGAFAVRSPDRIRGAAVLLVDDVRTTGATHDACSMAVAQAGARRVTWAVVAHAEGAAPHSIQRQKHNAVTPTSRRHEALKGALSVGEV
jgi:ComF family protein